MKNKLIIFDMDNTILQSRIDFPKMKRMVWRVLDELGLPAILTIEGANHRIAETVIQTTANKNQQVLVLDSMQGITAADVAAGASYLSIMQANLAVLGEALN